MTTEPKKKVVTKSTVKNKSASIPKYVDKEDLSEFFKVSTRQIERWEAEGCPVDKSERKNIYDLYEVFQWRFSKIKEKSMTELDLEKLRETRAKADIKEMEAEEKAGNLLPVDLIMPLWQAKYSTIKMSFSGLPSDIKVYAPETKQKVLDFTKKRINEILQELANENPLPKELEKVAEEYGQEFNSTT